MLQQIMIIIVTMLLSIAVTGLVLAIPLRFILARILDCRLGYWKTYILTCSVDAYGHMARVLFLAFIGSLAPSVTNQLGSWIWNGLLVLVIGAFVFKRCFCCEGVAEHSMGRLLLTSGLFTVMVLLRDLLLFIIAFEVMTEMRLQASIMN